MDNMKTSKIWITAIFVFYTLNLPCFAKSIALKLKFAPGDSTVYKLTEETEKTLDLEMGGNLKSDKTKKTIEMTFRQEIESVNREGNAISKITIEKLKYSSVIKNKAKIGFDSSRKEDLQKPMSKLIGQSYSVMISPKGEIVKVISADKIREITKSAKVTKINMSLPNRTAKTKYEYRFFGSSSPENNALTWLIGHDDFIKELHEVLLLPGTQKLKIGKSWDAKKALSIPPDSSEKLYVLQKVEDEGGHQIAIAEMKDAHPQDKEMGWGFPLAKTVSSKGYLKMDLDDGKIVKFKEEFRSEGTHSSPMAGKKDGKSGSVTVKEIRINSLERMKK